MKQMKVSEDKDLSAIMAEIFLTKTSKYGSKSAISDKSGTYTILIPIDNKFGFEVDFKDNIILIQLTLHAPANNGFVTYDHAIHDVEPIEYNPFRPTFQPQEIINNLVKMYESMRLVINKFNKHIKIIKKLSGVIPIHGKT